MDGWVTVCSLDEIPQRGSRMLLVEHAVPIAVFRTSEDRVFALEDRCPHKAGPLSQGLVAGNRVTCPLHGWTIDLDNGIAVAPDEGSVQVFPVQVRDGAVWMRRGDVASKPASTANTPVACAHASGCEVLRSGPMQRGD